VHGVRAAGAVRGVPGVPPARRRGRLTAFKLK
jgi:hypothetical protein